MSQASRTPRPDPSSRPITLHFNGWHPPWPHPPFWIVTDEALLYDYVNVIDNDGVGRFGRIIVVDVRRRRAPRRWWQLRGRTYMQRRVKVCFGING
jgi:hypothetical protein